jgi:hypothetical protein
VRLEYVDLANQLAALKVRLAMADFESARAWRDAVDTQRFERNAVAIKMRAIEADHQSAAAALVKCEAQLKATSVRRALVEAANKLLSTDPAFAFGTPFGDLQRAHGACGAPICLARKRRGIRGPDGARPAPGGGT